MTTDQKGKITELEILTYVTKMGIEVSIPFGEKNRYDQIWEIKNKLYKIQIKTSRPRRKGGNAIEFNCYSSSNGKRLLYNKDQIDFFATYYDTKVYLIPVEECSLEKTLWFSRNPNCKSFAEDYEIEKIIEKL